MDYTRCVGSKLKLKGIDKKVKKKKNKKIKGPKLEVEGCVSEAIARDTEKHGGWRAAENFTDLTGAIAVEFGERTYVKSLDDGTFVLGAPHGEGTEPIPEEVLVSIKLDDNKIALKSGYGKYLKADKNGVIIGRSDAVGGAELWEPIFQDGKLALLAANGKFLSVDNSDDSIVAVDRKADSSNFIRIRVKNEKIIEKEEIPDEEQGSSREIETKFVKKFQKFQDKKLRLNERSTEEVVTAQRQGNLHETLLDRREKMKADRYCK